MGVIAQAPGLCSILGNKLHGCALGLHRQLNLSNQKMEAEDLFSLGMDDWLLSEEEEETTKLLNQEEIRQLVKKKKTSKHG